MRTAFPPYYWRNEDKLDMGRPDVLYRLNVQGVDPTGTFEMKNFPVPELVKPFWSGLKMHQAMKLRHWASFNGGFSWLLMGVGAEWLLFWHKAELIQHHARKYTLAEFYEMSCNRGEVNDAGSQRLMLYLVDVHMRRAVPTP